MLPATVAASGIDSAMGYSLLRLSQSADAIRIFRLNVQEYLKSANNYDNFREAYMDAGGKALAIGNDRQSV